MPLLSRRIATGALLSAIALVAACQSPGVRNFYRIAEDNALEHHESRGLGFVHRVFVNGPARSGAVRRLHVYIDGDGIPWRGTGRPALDPTPRDPIVLRLMSSDPAPAIYLGRPCYLGLFDTARCEPWVWTHGRYGEAVVGSMVAALRVEAQRFDADELVLVGYSGGGTLAMLMADRVAAVSDVVTLAANLDLRAWAEHHGYSPLVGSIDPALRPALPQSIRQWHWVGQADRQVPPFVVRRGLRRQRSPVLEVLPETDHRCCWEAVWPGLLRRVEQRAALWRGGPEQITSPSGIRP